MKLKSKFSDHSSRRLISLRFEEKTGIRFWTSLPRGVSLNVHNVSSCRRRNTQMSCVWIMILEIENGSWLAIYFTGVVWE
jgi:hypothetical protein